MVPDFTMNALNPVTAMHVTLLTVDSGLYLVMLSFLRFKLMKQFFRLWKTKIE
jgi:hypothetical protein